MSNQKLHKELEDLVTKSFQGLSARDYSDLLAEAYIYIANYHPSTKELDDDIKDKVLSHLKKYFKKRQQEEAGTKFLGRSGVIPASHIANEFTEGKSDDEILSVALWKIKSKILGSWQEEDDEDSKKILESIETSREQLQQDLSLFEFEAMQTKTSDEVRKQSRFTLGFDNLGLFILFRRARIRMIWFEGKKL